MRLFSLVTLRKCLSSGRRSPAQTFAPSWSAVLVAAGRVPADSLANAAHAKSKSLAMGAAGRCLEHQLPPPKPRSFRSLVGLARKFRIHRNGASAVEFALVAAPFLAILLGTLELALIFIVNTGLNLGAQALATQMRTGQIQAPGLSATTSSGVQLDLHDAMTQLCNKVQIVSLASCMQQLQIDVRPLTSFHQTSSSSPISGGTFNSSNLCYYSGNAGDIVEMRVYYLYPLVDPLLSYAFSLVTSYTSSNGTSSGKYYPIQTTQVFKSERYSGQTNSGAGC